MSRRESYRHLFWHFSDFYTMTPNVREKYTKYLFHALVTIGRLVNSAIQREKRTADVDSDCRTSTIHATTVRTS